MTYTFSEDMGTATVCLTLTGTPDEGDLSVVVSTEDGTATTGGRVYDII